MWGKQQPENSIYWHTCIWKNDAMIGEITEKKLSLDSELPAFTICVYKEFFKLIFLL